MGKKSPRGPWYDLKGFFENKLTDPAVFDHGKYKPDPMDRLRMPKPNVTKEDIDALTTFLLGSTDPSLPPEYMYKPADQRAAIQKGWWIVTKYNCIGCHQIGIGQRSVLMGLPQYQGENKQNLPPVLTSEGRARQSGMAERLPGQSVAQHHGCQPERRAILSASAHAHVLLVGRRNPHSGVIL